VPSRGPRALIALAVVAIVGVGVYTNSLQVPFVFDDMINIRDNRGLRMTHFGLAPLRRAAFSGRSSARPVANVSFALNHYFGRDRVAGYHAVNIVVHMVNALLVYALARLSLELAGRRPRASAAASSPSMQRWAALAAAILFAAHPLGTQSVTYIVQRMNILAAMFYLLSLLLWVMGRRSIVPWKRWTLWVAAAACWVPALGSKQIAVTLPLVVWLYEGYFFRDMARRWLTRSFVAAVAALAAVVVIGLAYTDFDPLGRIVSQYAQRDFTLAERLMTQPRVVFHYFGLVLFPHVSRLNLLHHMPISASAAEPATTWICIAALGALLAMTVKLAAKQRLLSFCGLWWFIHLSIESSVWPLEMVFEHRTYLPMVGISVGAAYVLFGLLLTGRRAWAVAATVLALAMFAGGTRARNRTWQDSARLWRDVLAKNPGSHRATMNLGITHEDAGRLDEAIEHYRRSRDLNRNYARSWYNLSSALGQRGEHEEQIRCYRQAIELKPKYAEAHNNLGMALYTRDGAEAVEAIRHFRLAIRYRPDLAEAHVNLGMVLHSIGQSDEAARQYTRALRIDPLLAEAHNNLGIVAKSRNQYADAESRFRNALRIDPELADAHNNLGNVLVIRGEFAEAIDHFRTALELDPKGSAARVNWGRAVGMQGRLDEALEHMNQAVWMDPENAAAHSGLAGILLMMGRAHEAVNHYRQAVTLNPSHATLHYKLGLAVKQSGDVAGAMTHFRAALGLAPDWPQALIEVAWILATGSGGVQRQPAEAVELSERALKFVPEVDAPVLDALAAAYASAGHFERAAGTAQKAIDLAVASGRNALAAKIRSRLRRYRQGRALHEQE